MLLLCTTFVDIYWTTYDERVQLFLSFVLTYAYSPDQLPLEERKRNFHMTSAIIHPPILKARERYLRAIIIEVLGKKIDLNNRDVEDLKVFIRMDKQRSQLDRSRRNTITNKWNASICALELEGFVPMPDLFFSCVKKKEGEEKLLKYFVSNALAIEFQWWIIHSENWSRSSRKHVFMEWLQ